jgi:ornithine carrier protein
VLFPADTIKSAMQTRAELRPDQKHGLSFAGTAKEIYAARGLRGLYAGYALSRSPFLHPRRVLR